VEAGDRSRVLVRCFGQDLPGQFPSLLELTLCEQLFEPISPIVHPASRPTC